MELESVDLFMSESFQTCLVIFPPYKKEESGKEALDEMVETFDWQQMLGLVF